MNHEAAVSNAKDIADRVLAPAARQNDKEGRFSPEAIKALGPAGLLGLMLPADVGGSALGPRTFAAVISAIAEADASVAMVYLMHVCAAATIAAARNGATVAPTVTEIAAGRHLCRPGRQLCGLGAGAAGRWSDRFNALSRSEGRTRTLGRRRLGRSRFAGQRLRAYDA